MTVLQELGRVNRDIETQKAATEFASLCKFILSHSGRFSQAAIAAGASTRTSNLGPKLGDIIKSCAAGISREHFKAAQTAGTLTGGALADYSQIANGFVASLINAGIFDSMLASMVPIPLVTGTVGAINTGASAYAVSEGSAKPISKLSIVGQQVNPAKAHCIIVLTQELARAPGANAIALISRELRNAVAVTTDAQFLLTLMSGLSAIPSTGQTAESVRADLANLLRSISTGAASRLYVITTPLIVKSWSMLTDSKGLSAFPDLSPVGGMIQHMTVLPSDAMLPGNVLLADASGLAGASGDVELQEFKDASVQMDSAPDSPPLAASAFVSLWQLNQVGLVIERFFAAAKLRGDAVALCSNANSYQGGNSPP